MILFILLATVLAAVCVITVGRGLLKPAPLHDVDLQEENLSITRQRIEELNKQTPSTGETHVPDNGLDNQQNSELEAALLDDLQAPRYDLRNRRKSGTMTSVILLVAIPMVAAGLYQWLGNKQWQIVAGTADPHASIAVNSPDGERLDIGKLLERLEQALVEHPDNADGWALAGRTYMSMNDFTAAENAYQRVHQLVGDDPDILTAWADASLMVNGGQYTQVIAGRISRALELDPDQTNALWIAAMGSRSNGDMETSLKMMERLRPLLASNPQALEQLDMLIGSQPNTSTQAAPSMAPVTAESDPSASPDSASELAAVTVTVQLSDDLRGNVGPTDTVFVYARAVAGPPFPLAAHRTSVAALPLTVTLDQSMAMMPDQHIGTVEEVMVTARIAKSGTPTAQPGDLTSRSVPLATRSNSPVTLVIDQLVQ